MRTIAATFLGAALLSGSLGSANEIGFLESFALAQNREDALKQLIPGTQEYYYYNALHLQNSGRLDEVDQILKVWIERYKRTPQVIEIESRQALLRYGTDPRASLEYLRSALGLHFNHQRESLDEKPTLSTSLNPSLISRETLSRIALQRHTETLEGFEDRALDWVIGMPLSEERRRHLLSRLDRPDHSGLPRLVVEDLNTRRSRGFGSHAIHGRLLLAQLDECLRLKPDLLENSNFVNTYLTKLWPNPDVEWRHDPAARQAFLDRLWAFVSRLPPAFNSLKVHVLYHRLVHDRVLGVYDKSRFLQYIQLPRNVSYINPEYVRRQDRGRFTADLSSDFKGVTRLPPVGDDEPLVRSYLEHFFLTEDGFAPYSRYIRDTYLKRRFAETKILAGLGDQEEWYSMLSPAEYRALKDRVDIDFAATNKTHFSPDEQVSLDLDVKNVKSLIVKVFEINTLNYYRSNQREVDTAVDLDGLVANHEETHSYTEPELRRVRRHFEFPKLQGRGVYVIEFIGNGKSSRALVRKGQLRFLVRSSTAGQDFTVLDESNRKLRDAKIWMGGHTYEASREDGEIRVPYSNQPGRRPIVLIEGGFASLDSFQHESESYALHAGIHVEREALVRRQKASVLVRPSLALNGTPVSLSLLEDVRLVITSTDLDGVSTTREIADFALYEDRESSQEFQVPPNLASVQFTLRARVENLSAAKKQDLEVTKSYQLNGIDRSERLEDLHLARMPDGYKLDVLGKTGESRADRPVKLTLKHRDFRDTVSVTLQSDGDGRIDLGTLEGIEWLSATGPEGTSHQWFPGDDVHSLPRQVQGRAGETLSIPYMGREEQARRSDLSLLETRRGTFVRDRFEALAIEDGFLHLRGLPAGDYDLFLKGPRRQITVRLSAGEHGLGYVLSPYRQLEERNARPLQIATVDTTKGDSVLIRLENATRFARVHVAATRYLPEYPLYPDVDAVPYPEPYRVQVPSVQSLYVVGRDIGDEYRYILERKQARKFPGNMLGRPSLLLNPWDIQATQTGVQLAGGGGEFSRRVAPGESARAKGQTGRPAGGVAATTGFSNLDFLGRPAALLMNLRPDDDGVVSIARQKLGAGHYLHIVAVDPENTAYRQVALPEMEPQFDDLRLLTGLNPEKHYTEQKNATLVEKGATLRVEDITTSELEVYDTLGKVYSLFVTLTGDPNLVQFGFIRNWPELDEEKRRELYSQYACHELNFFIYKKDPKFFEEVIKPYLANKYHKTFLDHWLLGDDLDSYLSPWAYSRLNVVERILLAGRIRGEAPHTARHISDLADLIPPDIEHLNELFATALLGRALETTDELGLREAEEKAGELKKAGDANRRAFGALRRGRSRGLGLETLEDRAVKKAPAAPAAATAAARPEAEAPLAAKELAGAAEGAKTEADKYFREEEKQRQQLRQLYRKLEKTREWVENNYYRLPIEQQDGDLIPVNPFWRDFAQRDRERPFYSTKFAEASKNFTEMIFALSVLDLPFKAGEHGTKAEGQHFELTAASPLIVFHKEIREASEAEPKVPILVSQNFYRHGDRYRQVGGERVDKYITDEFVVHTAYGCHVVITNPGSSRQKLDVLLQIPRGAIPLLGGRYTRSLSIILEPYRTWTQDYFFYFPAPGQAAHYPVHVAKDEKLVASAPAVTLNVVEKPSRLDRESWNYVSQRGSADDVIRFLQEHNLGEIRLDRIAWRMRDKSFFRRVVDLLRTRHVYEPTLWSYSIYHDEASVVREYLPHLDGFVQRLGGPIDSKLLTVDPVERHSYQHREYWPLVNARAHRLGKTRRILNDRFYQQYMQYMKVLSYLPRLDDEDLIGVTYYLLLQDRIEEALAFFQRARPENLASKLQYDYFAAQLGFYTENPRRAREIASQYEHFPVKRWRNLFTGVLAQLDELEGNQPVSITDHENRSEKQTELADTEALVDFDVEGNSVTLRYRNIDRCRVDFYPMDIELLFSRNPFVQAYSGQFSSIRPNMSLELELDPQKDARVFDIPERFHSANLLIEISGGGAKKAVTHFSNNLALQLTENYAQLKVTKEKTGKPLPRVYVKVYARMKDGAVRFYKDGYTDLRGRFDYGSLSTDELSQVERFSLLVFSDDDDGALVREAAPPQM